MICKNVLAFCVSNLCHRLLLKINFGNFDAKSEFCEVSEQASKKY